jgi:hypothetical protein
MEEAMNGAEIEGNLEVPKASMDRAWNGAYGQIFEAVLHRVDGKQQAVSILLLMPFFSNAQICILVIGCG